MKLNKKGYFPGAQMIASFFIASILFVFAIGFYDFTIVEVYDPIHDTLEDSLDRLNITSGLAHDEFDNNYDATHGKNLPFNLLYIFLFIYAITFSIINVANSKKMDPMELILKSIGGLVFFIYLMQLVILKIVNYFQIEIVEYLFQDLIASYVPFYIWTYNNMGMVCLVWAVSLIITNWFIGKKDEDVRREVFG